ncbi:MAG TPA: polynucleotide adenylyltransferase PcnB, partial [Polyangiaceae bacterium]|nr:polynucleotide adenylyltransferase PcnB [Polyangiaceae bacterium]
MPPTSSREPDAVGAANEADLGSVAEGSPRDRAERPVKLRSGPEPIVYPIDLEEQIDPDAAKVMRRLVKAGYEAYLVGGGVRDLLVGITPKDFDVATNARPDDVRRLFRNSRIIGRRFRLVHVLFGGGKVIETATFRRAPQQDDNTDSEDLLIRTDNVFGEAHQDAARRDFTINALFYDLEHHVVLDWVGGMPDIERRTVHTIGDPSVRFREDPVRILRAIKFSARLDFGVSPAVYDAMVECRQALARAAKPRLFEELLKLLRSGAAHRGLWLMWELGVLDVLLPELSTYLADQPEHEDTLWRLLDEVDRITNERGPLDDVVLISVL